MNPIRLEQMALFDAGPLGLVDIAADLGVSKVSFWTASQGRMEGYCLVNDDTKRSVRERLRDTGVVADNVEVFRLSSNPDLDIRRHGLDVAAYLGATSAAVVNNDLPEDNEAADSLARFAELADGFGLITNLEPLASGATRTLAQAERVVRQSGSASARIAVDVLHLVRTGGSPADLRALDPALIGYAQICDGPATMPTEGLRNESSFNRLPPGEGEFPLVEFVAALPADVVIGIEVPMRSRQQAGMGPRERAAIMVSGTRAIQELAGVDASRARQGDRRVR